MLPTRRNEAGPLLAYLRELAKTEEGRKLANEAINATRRATETPDGRILLELFNKSLTETFLPPHADPCALSALNAQRFIALDLRRIASDDNERILDQARPVPRTR